MDTNYNLYKILVLTFILVLSLVYHYYLIENFDTVPCGIPIQPLPNFWERMIQYVTEKTVGQKTVVTDPPRRRNKLRAAFRKGIIGG